VFVIVIVDKLTFWDIGFVEPRGPIKLGRLIKWVPSCAAGVPGPDMPGCKNWLKALPAEQFVDTFIV
jgi:hypothetical protein